MRHRVKKVRLSRNEGQRKAVLRSLVRSLLISESVTTTVVKAKAAKSKAVYFLLQLCGKISQEKRK